MHRYAAWQIHNHVKIKILKLRHLLKESGSYPYFQRLEHKACKEWSRIFQRQKVTETIWYSNMSKISFIECNIWNTKYFNVSAFWMKYPSTDALTPCHPKWQYWANLKLKIQGNTNIQNITKEKEQKRSALRGNLIQLTSVQHALHKKKSPPVRPPYMYVCTCIQHICTCIHTIHTPLLPRLTLWMCQSFKRNYESV